MSGWGIADTASEIEKIKAESADYLRGLNSCCLIDWNTYDKAFDFYMGLIDASYEQGKKDAEQRWIPCSEETGEGFPKEDGRYYVTEQNYGFYLDADYKEKVAHMSIFKDGDFTPRFYDENHSNITAYFKLPEPYGGEQDG